MPFPTASWGQANWSDVYTALPVGSGLQLGSTELLFDGSIVQFLQFVASTIAGAACTVYGSAINYQVTPTTAALQLVLTCNDRSGGGLGTGQVTIAANSYAWGTIRGIAYPLVATTIAAGKFLVSTTSTGVLSAFTVGTDIQSNIYNTVTVGGANAQSPVQIV